MIVPDKKYMQQLCQMKQLLNLAACDGCIDKRELAIISSFIDNQELGTEDFERCLRHPSSVRFEMPKNTQERKEYLMNMVLLMLSDGIINDEEMRLCRLTAEAFGLDEETLHRCIELGQFQIQKILR